MNIAEILKYCPKGTKLYCILCGNAELEEITNIGTIVIRKVVDAISTSYTLDYEGRYSHSGECVLFPSKDQRDWNKFRLPVKRGDIMMSDNKAFIISDEYADAFNNAFHKYICGIDTTGTFKVSQLDTYWTSKFYIPASEEAKKELFDKIAEAGYKWNADTLELEKLEPKFKKGDVVSSKKGDLYLVLNTNNSTVHLLTLLYKDGNFIAYNTFSMTSEDLTIATEEERNKFYSTLVREGYKYDKWQHKFIKQEFKPFDKVLVRGNDTEFWKADIYLGYTKNNSCPYRCTKANYGRCIPYEGNEYLLDTANSNMCRQERIESIRNWLKSCKQEVMLGKKLSPDTFDQIINEFNNYIAFEEETRKSTIEYIDNLTSKVSRAIEDINNKRKST